MGFKNHMNEESGRLELIQSYFLVENKFGYSLTPLHPIVTEWANKVDWTNVGSGGAT